ncbi:MAG: hypothetical protein R3B09_18125 [Nannocystaceae bacterium]
MDAGCQRGRGRRGAGRSIGVALALALALADRRVEASTPLATSTSATSAWTSTSPLATSASTSRSQRATSTSDGSSPLAADPATIDGAFVLEWSAPSTCPDAAAVRAAIRRILRDTPRERLAGRSVRASAELRREPRRFALALRLEVDGVVSERAMQGATCAVLGDATALLIAMTIDPLARPSTGGAATIAPSEREPVGEVLEPAPSGPALDPPSGPALAPPSGPPSGPALDPPSDPPLDPPRDPPLGPALDPSGTLTPTDDLDDDRFGLGDGDDPRATPDRASDPKPGLSPPPTAARARRGPLRALLGVALLGGSAGLGSVGLGGGATIGVGRRRWRVELAGAYWAPRVRALAIDGQEGARVELRLGTAGVRGCGVPSYGRIELPLCAGVELGGLRGDGLDVAGARRHVGPWAAVTASPGVLVRLGDRVALALRVDAALAISRPTFEVHGHGVVFKADAGALAASLGVELRLPR